MRISSRSKLSIAFTFFALAAVIAGLLASGALRGSTSSAHAAKTAASPHATISCASGSPLCTEVADSEQVFGEGHYVGHDEPSTLFYSNQPGSGNQMRYELTLPRDPSPTPLSNGKSFNFQLHPAFWFGMAMCATMSYPELLSTCTPDSDKNIVDPAISPRHPGTAFMEMQFYPPGWAPFQLPGGISCDPTKWCAALNIDSLAEDPVHGTTLNPTCAAITGLEYVNFAFITLNGQSQAPANPVDATAATFTPDPAKDLFMNSGDELLVTLHDTADGLQIVINDETTGQIGSMTSSAANGFGQVQYLPAPSTACNNVPYDFHPMYSTSSEKTRVTWAAHSYNIAFSDEIGHWDYCTQVNTSNLTCTGNEGIKIDQEPADSNDTFCLPASVSLLIPVSGCAGQNDPGFDGTSYQPLWPDGNLKLHPTPVRFSSPLTGAGFNVQYQRMAFEADLPRIEFTAGTCNRQTGIGCTLIPTTDDGQSAVFYPFFSIGQFDNQCNWMLGNHIPGSRNDFGQNNQYGQLLTLTYTLFGGGGAPFSLIEDFRQILSSNPCKAS
jgi:hypothetical protein